MRKVGKFGWMLGLALLVVACGTQRRVTAIEAGELVAGAEHVQIANVDPGLRAFLTSGTHKTVTTITDLSDPANPEVVYQKEGNLLSSCGVRNLFANALGLTDMGAASGGGETLGTYCAGLCQTYQRIPSAYNNHTRIVIGAGSASTCSSAGTPWACCTGSGTGCAVSNLDVALFAMGQPNGSLTGVQTNYAAWYAGGSANVFDPGGAYVDAVPTLYWNGASLQGIQFVQTYSGTQANQQWCEYGVYSDNYPNDAGALYVGSGRCGRGWMLNHASISPCLTKSSGQTFQLTVTITLS